MLLFGDIVRPMTQLWPEGLPIEVDTVDDQPVGLRWHHRRRSVRAVTNHWLIHDDWWLEEIWRHYFEVQTAGTAQTWAYVGVRDNFGLNRKIIGPGTVNTVVKDTDGNLVALSCPCLLYTSPSPRDS